MPCRSGREAFTAIASYRSGHKKLTPPLRMSISSRCRRSTHPIDPAVTPSQTPCPVNPAVKPTQPWNLLIVASKLCTPLANAAQSHMLMPHRAGCWCKLHKACPTLAFRERKRSWRMGMSDGWVNRTERERYERGNFETSRCHLYFAGNPK